jgi:hypothetical protein
MPNFTPLFRELTSEGWFVTVVGIKENRVAIDCEMFSRDYDPETGYTDIVFGDTVEEEHNLWRVCVHYATFELRRVGPADVIHPQWQWMPPDMFTAIAALMVPANFPEVARFLNESETEDTEETRMSFWASIAHQVSSMVAAGDAPGALKLQTEATDKLIRWKNPPPEEVKSIPEPNLEDMVPLRYSLIEAADADAAAAAAAAADEDTYLPVGGHLLPQDFQNFLRAWNKTIATSTGDWTGDSRWDFKAENPELWRTYKAENKRFSQLYPSELAALKAYQTSPEGLAERGKH